MHYKHRLKRRADFKRVFNRGVSHANHQFVVYSFDRKDESFLRLGISVSKKVGNAVVRNRIKRYLKEIVRNYIDELPKGLDLVVIARNPVATMDYTKIEQSINNLFIKAKIMSRNVPR